MGIAHLLMWHALSQLNSFTCLQNQPFLQKFQKISQNQPNFEIFPIKLVSLNKSCILRSHWFQNHLKTSNPLDFPKISQFCKKKWAKTAIYRRLWWFSYVENTFFGIVGTSCMKIHRPCILPYWSPENPRQLPRGPLINHNY